MFRYLCRYIYSGRIFRASDGTLARKCNGGPHLGVSILEVLFAIGVVAVGLLGVLALIPIAGARVTRGTIADMGDRLGRNAVREFHVRGMSENGAWWRWTGWDTNFTPPEPVYQRVSPTPGVTTFCIDPLFVAKHVAEANDIGGNLRFFPSHPAGNLSPANAMARVNLAMGQAPQKWSRSTRYVVGQFCQPISGTSDYWYVVDSVTGSGSDLGLSGTTEPFSGTPTVGGITNDNNVRWMCVSPAMRYDEAMSTFMSGDDLAFDLPADNTLYPYQNYSRNAAAEALKRQYQGSFSWLATLAPLDGGLHLLSIAVFHRRVLEADYEKVVDVDAFRTGGLNGGDVTLKSSSSDDLEMKQGEWVMLFGHDGSVNHYRWYRIQIVDSEPWPEGGDHKRDLTLFGEEWTLEANQTKVLWIPATIAVYERRVRLKI